MLDNNDPAIGSNDPMGFRQDPSPHLSRHLVESPTDDGFVEIALGKGYLLRIALQEGDLFGLVLFPSLV